VDSTAYCLLISHYLHHCGLWQESARNARVATLVHRSFNEGGLSGPEALIT